MAADVQEFYDQVSELINRGTTFDSQIPQYVARALRFLEQNYTFDYMKVRDPDFHNITIGVEEYEYPPLVKSFHDWEYTEDDGDVVHLTKVDVKDITSRETATPVAYYTEGKDSIWLDSVPTESLTSVLWSYQYTDWSLVELGDSPWMVTYGEGLLRVQTVILMGPRLRDAKLIQLCLEEKKEHLKVMSLAEEDFEAGDDDPAMDYVRV